MDTKALRQKILDLAIRGKLVPQDPNDEPASVLLERIRAEKQQMVKDGKLKPKDIKNDTVIFKGDDNLHYEKFSDGTVKCIEDKIPFDIPDSWVWCRLNDLALYKKGPFGSSITKAMFVPESDNVIKVYEQKNAINKSAQLGHYFISQEKYEELKGFEVFPGDIIVSCAGTIGETFVMPHDMRKGIINQALMKIHLFDSSVKAFYLMYFDNKLKTLANEQGYGMALKNIPPFSILKRYLIPIPPKAEQERILDHIKIILSNINDIDLLAGKLKNDVANAKSKILDLAIRGKLVPQDPNDEPASVLLERIRAEKEELIKQGKIKRDKKESVIFKGDDNSYYEKIGDTVTCIDDKIPFEIPESWCWTRLNHITINHDSYRKPINSSDRKNRIVGKEKSKLYPYYGATGQVGLIDDYLFDGEYILLGEDAAPFLDKNAQKAYMIIGKSWVNNHAHILKPLILSKYLTHCLNSINYLNYVYGTTRLKLTQENMNKILIPVPPFKEQQRLIHKIDSIMGSINQINLSNKSK